MRPWLLAAWLALGLSGPALAQKAEAQVALRIPYILKVEIPGQVYVPGEIFPFHGTLTIRVVSNGRFLLRIQIPPGEEAELAGQRLGSGEHVLWGRGRMEVVLQGKGWLILEPGG
ncbi:hypothetical protein YIM1640_19620 [Thermus oshimai]|jgi:hypothetical protein